MLSCWHQRLLREFLKKTWCLHCSQCLSLWSGYVTQLFIVVSISSNSHDGLLSWCLLVFHGVDSSWLSFSRSSLTPKIITKNLETKMLPTKLLTPCVCLVLGFQAVSLLMPLVRVEKVPGLWQVDGSQSRSWSLISFKINLIKIDRLNLKTNQHQSGLVFLRLCFTYKLSSKTLPTKWLLHGVE